MEWVIQWIFLILSLAILVYWLIYPPYINWLIVFLFSAYLALPLGVILVRLGYFSFPVRFLSSYFESSILFEYLVLPILSVIYYKSTMRLAFLKSAGYAMLYSIGIASLEVILEKYTNLMVYIHWSFFYTLWTTFSYLLVIRVFVLAYVRRQ